MPLRAHLFSFVTSSLLLFAFCGNIPPDSSCGPHLVKYTQMTEELEAIPAMLQHLTGLFQTAKKRSDDAQAELDIRQSKYNDCKKIEPDENGWVAPDVCRLSLEPEIKGYTVIVEDNQKMMSNMSPSIQAAEVRLAELTRDTQEIRSRLSAQSCPLDGKMSPAKRVASEPKLDL
jgi:hypothetical protein